MLDRTAIGGVGVTGAGTATPKIGYDVVESYRMRGHATEAVRLLSDYLLTQFKGAIFAETLRDNMGSAKVLMITFESAVLRVRSQPQLHFSFFLSERNSYM